MTLDSICRSYILNQGKNTLHGYIRCMKFLIDFMRDFSLNHAFMDKTIVLKLDEKKAIQWPDDFVTWNKIGWKNGDRIVAFQRDSSIALQQNYCEDVGSATLNPIYNVDWPYNGTCNLNNFSYLGRTGGLQCYMVGYNWLGYFRVNHQAREIQFSSETPSDFEIYLEYKTNGFNPKTKSEIPEYAAKLGENYIHWQMSRYKNGDAAAETQAREIAYEKSYDTMIGQIDKLSMADITGAMAQSFDINKIAR